MLRRRIFSGAMASVMALSSVAVVASAEETNYKTKADLEKLVNETYGDAFRSDKLSEYGSVSAEAVLDALEAADAVLYDADADAEDYTVAYMMVEATVARLVIHTAEELQTLIDDCTGIYESNNIYNEELQDLIYTDTSYDALVTAYDNACNYVTSSSSVDITEAYEQLAAAKAGLTKMAVVSKSMFRNVMKQYEAVISAEFKYEDWRRGQLGWTDISTGNFWAFTGGTSTAAYGTMWEAAMACQDTVNAAYESLDAIKTLSKTSDTDIVNGYKMAQDAVAVFNSWTVDSSTRATKAGVSALLKEYHSVLVADYATTAAEELYAAIAAVGSLDADKSNTEIQKTTGTATTFNGGSVEKLVDASWTVRPTVSVYVPVDKDGYCVDTTAIVAGTRPAETDLPTGAAKWQMISAKTNYDILKMVAVTADDVTADGDYDPANNAAMDHGNEWPYFGWGAIIAGDNAGHDWGAAINGVIYKEVYDYEGAVINLSTAYALAMDYLDGDDSYTTMTDEIDTTGVVANDDYKGNSKEWAIVYRYLNYALADKYDASVSSESYTKADVKALIEKAYDLAELTGDAAIFETAHMNLVNARQAAIDWVKLANSDKMYKEYTGRVAADGTAYDASTVAYKALYAQYELLEKEYNAMKYSFGDIYSKLAEVAEMIDDGDLEAKADLMTALDNTAYALSVVTDEIDHSNGTYDENAAFNVDREFQAYNRVITTGDATTIATIGGDVKAATDYNVTHYNLWQAYESLLTAINAQTAPDVLLGDVDGNGTVNALDAAALLTAIVDGKTLDAAVADYDKNGAVNALDAGAILTAIVNG